jgi:hypothetical protein
MFHVIDQILNLVPVFVLLCFRMLQFNILDGPFQQRQRITQLMDQHGRGFLMISNDGIDCVLEFRIRLNHAGQRIIIKG